MRARTQALEPIDLKYATALRALKDKLTKSGDLEGALQVDAELKKLTQSLEPLRAKVPTNATDKAVPPDATLSKFAGTSWENRKAGSKIEFLTRGRYLEEWRGQKKTGTWKTSSDSDTVEVISDHDETYKYSFKLNSKHQILTRSDNLVYTPTE